MSDNLDTFKNEVIKEWKKVASPKTRKLLNDSDIRTLLEYIYREYETNPDDENFQGNLSNYIKDLIDIDESWN